MNPGGCDWDYDDVCPRECHREQRGPHDPVRPPEEAVGERFVLGPAAPDGVPRLARHPTQHRPRRWGRLRVRRVAEDAPRHRAAVAHRRQR